MKKCASCTKDLPDAALHCVFCGAKQPPAPAAPQAMAKTAFGYSPSDMQEQLRQSAAQQGRAQPAPQPAPGFPPPAFAPPRPAPPPSHQPIATQPTMLPDAMPRQPPTMVPGQPQGPAPALGWAPTQALPAHPGQGSFPGSAAGQGQPGPGSGYGPGPGSQVGPGPQRGPGPQHGFGPGPQPGFGPQPGPGPQYSSAPGPQPGPGPGPGHVPPSSAGAKTMFAPGPSGPAPQGSFGPGAGSPAMPATLVPPPMQPVPIQSMPRTMLQQAPQPPMVPAMPQSVAVPMAIPRAMPQPYNASQSLMRRPIDPWRDSLRAMLFIWGVLLLGAFATPLATSPQLVFSWTTILDGAGSARLPPLVLAAVGLLSVIVAVIPMPTAPRGVIATLLGLAGIFVPILIVVVPPWQSLLMMVGTLLLVPGLLIRSEYRASLLPRILVTLGVLAMLLPLVLPANGAIPLVSSFKALIDLPGSAKVGPALELGLVAIIVVALLFTWMPGPVNGGAKLWAWLVILWTLIVHVTLLLLAGHLGDAISQSPHAALVPWIYGAMAPGGGVALGSAYLVIIGYGLASALGKQLE